MIRLVFAAIATLATVAGAQGQAYPDKTIRIISGTQTGTSGDLAGRLLAQKLTTQMGQPVVFESRPGANGQIAANYVKNLPPDGYNVGINIGTAAWQTIEHAHLHLIPRYRGDTEDPRGGVRWIMPPRAAYWHK